MNNIVRNIIMAAATAVPVGAAVGTATSTSTVNLPAPIPKVLPTGPVIIGHPGPLYGPPQFNPISGSGGSGGPGNGQTGVIWDTLTYGKYFCYPGEPDLNAAIDIRTNIMGYRTGIGKPVTHDTNLDIVAQNDALLYVTVAFPANTIINNQTIIQRVKKVIPTAKNASEILVKGCFPTSILNVNTPNDIYRLILTEPGTTAIMNNPAWNRIGTNVQTIAGSPFGVVWVIVFAQVP
jgi:hypothetical protein